MADPDFFVSFSFLVEQSVSDRHAQRERGLSTTPSKMSGFFSYS